MAGSPVLRAHDGIAVWSDGPPGSDVDVWFLHAFADSHLSFRDAYAHLRSERIRIFLFDLPGHGASPPRAQGLTVEAAAQIWCGLIERLSASRRVVLVGHSMASIIATRVAQMLRPAPTLVISVEGNLTLADAYLSGQAAGFDEPGLFYASFQSRTLEMAKADEVLRRYACSVQFADPKTLWTLGRSVLGCATPGADFMSLTCSSIYYWDSGSTVAESKAFLERHHLPQRKMDGLGHWPMVKAPAQFYAAVEKDVARVLTRRQRNSVR